MKNLIHAFTIYILAYSVLNISCQKLDIVPVTKLCDIPPVSNIGCTSATVKGRFMDVSEGINSYGHCWSTDITPDITDSKTTKSGVPPKQVDFTSELTGLNPNTKYYVRLYASIGELTTYGEVVSFTTLEDALPTVTTTTISEITKTTAISGGNVTNDGGLPIAARGVCWGLTQNPTINDNKTNDGTGTGQYTSSITGLTAVTKYFIRAYATNSNGTAYGENIEFYTNGEFFLVGTINNWNIHGQYMEKRPNGIYVAYQFLTSSDQFKFYPTRDDWNNCWGAQGGNCGTDGTAVPGGGNICANNQPGFNSTGFYEIKFDAINHTVALTLISSIGVVGTAINGDWSTDIDLTYSSSSKKWQGQVTFRSTGEYKFWANNAWNKHYK
jgi:hypothetical protein